MADRSIGKIFFQLPTKHWIGICILIALLLVPLSLAVVGSGEALHYPGQGRLEKFCSS